MAKNSKSEQLQFKAETKQLLNILIHSLYTEREIFLREIISNASDAIARLNFELLTNKELVDAGTDPKITIKTDKENHILTVSDTGIGMNKDELVTNLGTIAHSGAKAFLEAAAASGDNNITNVIGQFGVGFYSAFMVADKIEVRSRSFRPEDKPVVWTSDGGETYEISQGTKENRGTDIVIYLKEDAFEFSEDYRIKQIIKRHSDYIPFPILINDEEEQLNRQTAIWRQQSHQVKQEEYAEFYKQFTYDFNDPISQLHLSIDAPVQLYALLYLPNSPEHAIYSDRKDFGLKLYARKILIQEYTRELLPEFFRFIQGVVDSEDIPLNVSRESFQSTKAISQIKKILTAKVIDHIQKLSDTEPEKFKKFWEVFGFFIKEGLATDMEYFDQLVPLLRFKTINQSDQWVSLDNYTENMVKDQKKIYYIVGEEYKTLINSPHLEALKKRKIDVIVFHDPVDPFMIMRLTKFKDFDLVNVSSKDLDLPEVVENDEENKDEDEKTPENINEILTFFKTTLGDRIKEVRTTDQLVESPARLVDSDDSPSKELQMAYQYLQKEMEAPSKVLEINPRHPIIQQLSHLQGLNPVRELVIEQIYENTLLVEGMHVNASDMVSRINKLLVAAMKTNGAE